ncbi:hypothetical protein [Arthrobacter bambusae]|uniref:hypothetical protein n=1 Tax=Arthrobacter bambusae TaxID=1338426 RepID=UPI00278B95C8|nr:hypothetical protein [Arthrobacter bambusae]MDQ0029605.1 hypothetical protein [Arthrobacter bambusae]MDQ0097265.1 hypothetical protein [Arthrobacter bambusae]
MDSTETHARHPDRPTVESDPAYDYGEDLEVDEDLEEQSEVIDDDERPVPLDVDEHREAEEIE